MYLEFFKLWDEPFGVTPDPAYLYPSQTHLSALDALRNGILGGRGFMTLIAEPGMGKTTLLYQLIEQLPQTTRTAYLFQTQCNSLEFMQYLLSELGVDPASMGLVAMHRKLNEMLFDEMVHGKQFVLIVDESQNLSNAVLETIRLLSNFETSHSKLLQIVLAGQPELANKLKQPDLSQLLQRITVMAHLDAFSFEETAAYIRHRLKLAGHAGADIFDPAGLAAVYRRSHGVPRNINRICHAALSLAQEEQTHTVSAALVEKSNRGLGSTIEELQKSRFAVKPRPMPLTGAPTQEDTVAAPPPPVAPSVATTRTLPTEPVATPTPPPPLPIPPLPPPSVSDDASQAAPDNPQIIPPPLPEYIPPPPPKRSYAWLGWTAVFATLLVLAALVIPSEVRQTVFQKFQPIVGSAASSSDPRPSSPVAAKTATSTTSAKQIDPAGNPATEGAKNDATSKGLKIVIDPGHGGSDAGTNGPNGLLEKSVCMEVALRLGQLIEDGLPGSEVIYTRSEDQNISPSRRAAISNDSPADLFISIHADALGDSQGLQAYFPDAAPEKKSKGPVNDSDVSRISQRLAAMLQTALLRQLALKGDATPTRAPAQPTFAVLNSVHAPAAVVEIPFSGPESPMLDPEKRQQVAEGLYRGIAAFVKELPDRTTR
jgi:type II secretory pathway predicted ATPase ExeA